ncbi:NeuD/PglB/VioB family sugar acetyltransferase [Nocardioides donggukensis]|uniref:NeuD/PglB/VioB family sugar acetyltransferase n=1 Tax=Nocardioides donggukensis TaxID=2774019 RepID=A0A927K7M0_9ACTN|nr:NeuD/PglB/VioB family sugar acetyltransferase [Nocardioides donggukensis]MBD8870488.1 NeuD/PglB/VioB family sugar acetyltransferase [Nocardioides donggukensis]
MKLIVVAASGLAREALNVARLLGRATEVRMLDDDPGLWGTSVGGHPVVGGLELAGEYDDHQFLVCAGRGSARRGIVDRLARQGVTRDRYAPLVHPDVRVPVGCSVGRGSVVLAGAVLTADVRIGDHAVVMPHVTLTHDDVVEDFATLCAGVALGGGVRVRQGAYLGMGCSVREGLVVGVDATLGMGATLVRDLPDGETWAGTPARSLESSRLLGGA